MRRKSKNNWQSVVSYIILSLLLFIAVFFVYRDIKLRKGKEQLDTTLEEYEALKIEIESLTQIKEKYSIAKKNNEELEKRKEELEEQKNELNAQIDNLKKKIEKLK